MLQPAWPAPQYESSNAVKTSNIIGQFVGTVQNTSDKNIDIT
jgi:hypothetical protein